MRLEFRYFVILIAAMVLCLVVGAKQSHDKGTWEYKILLIDRPNQPYSDDEKILNQNGAEGWELIGNEGRGTYFLKRAK